MGRPSRRPLAEGKMYSLAPTVQYSGHRPQQDAETRFLYLLGVNKLSNMWALPYYFNLNRDCNLKPRLQSSRYGNLIIKIKQQDWEFDRHHFGFYSNQQKSIS